MKKGVTIKCFIMLGFSFLLMFCSVNVSAEENLTYVDYENPYIYQEGYFGEVPTVQRRLLRSVDNVQQVILDGLTSLQAEIDLSSYNIPRTEIAALFTEVINSNSNLFYVSGSFSYSYMGNYIKTIKPKYLFTIEQIPAKNEIYEAEIAKILQVVEDDMTDEEKLLAIHDHMAAEMEYISNNESSTSYGAIVNKKAICSGYSLALNELYRRIGVETIYITSNSMNHAWNMVNLDGEWYHIDLTWDDPVPNREGRVLHTYFLLSDSMIRARRHSGWITSAPTATSTKFDAEFWGNIQTKLIYHNNDWYFTESSSQDDHQINSYNYPAGEKQTVKDITCRWKVWNNPNGYWFVTPMLASYNNRLYYNTPTSIINMNFDGSDEAEYTPNVTNGYIYGLGIHDDIMKYQVSTTPNATGTTYTYNLLTP